jgi:hypothetical protein
MADSIPYLLLGSYTIPEIYSSSPHNPSKNTGPGIRSAYKNQENIFILRFNSPPPPPPTAGS